MDYGIEHDPRYNEIMFLLDQHDEQIDPLSNNETVSAIDWRYIKECTAALLKECIDLRVIIWLLRASLNIDGVSSLYNTIKNIDEVLAEGRTVFPQYPDEPKGSGYGVALDWLSSSSCLAILKDTRLTPDINITLEDFNESVLSSDDSASGVSFSEMVLIVNNANSFYTDNGYPLLDEQFEYVVSAISRIENYVNQYNNDYCLNCQRLTHYINNIAKRLKTLCSSVVDVEGDIVNSDGNISDPLLARAENNEGIIRSRHDAILMLNRVIEYFSVHEPSHPAPIFIRRAQKMVGMDFEEIVGELFPEVMSSVQQYSGNK